jgi:hypothetical protein
MNKSDFRRKKLFVNQKLQGYALRRVVAYWLIYHVVLWHAMLFYHYMQHKFDVFSGAPPILFGELYGSFLRQHYSTFVCAMAIFPIIFWDMLRATHRVAGPLVRFQNALLQLARGEQVGRIQLRKGDLLTDMEDAFNKFIDSTGSTDEADASSAANVQREWKGSDTSSDVGELQSEYGQVFEDLQAMDAAVGDVRTEWFAPDGQAEARRSRVERDGLDASQNAGDQPDE